MTLDRDPSDVFYDKWKDTEDRLAAAEAALADYKDVSGEQYDYDTLRDLRARAEAAEARAVAAEAERDEAWRVSEYRRTAAKKHMNALTSAEDALGLALAAAKEVSDRCEAAEAERDAARRACEKAIRERRSLEIKEDDWHRAYERQEARVAAQPDASRFTQDWPRCHGDRTDLGSGRAVQPDELNPSMIDDLFVRCSSCRGAGGECECGGTGFDWGYTDEVRALLTKLMKEAAPS